MGSDKAVEDLREQRDEERKHQPGEAGRPSVRDEDDPDSPGERRGRAQTGDDRFKGREGQRDGDAREEIRQDDEVVDEASDDSFPASDPPSYTGSTGG